MPLRIVFFGTPVFAQASLEALADSTHPIAAVVTQPDRPRGRGHKIQPAAVKRWAERRGVPVLQPDRLRDDGFRMAVAGLEADLGVVAAYGKLLPPWLLELPRLGTINVHASLLPRWRGAAPIHRAVIAGDRETGVTIMRVVAALDAGPMLSRTVVPIEANETSVELEARLATAGGRLLVETVDRMAAGPVQEVAQDESGVTYASRLERHESRIDWQQPAAVVHNLIRGLQPWPLAAAIYRGRRVLLLGSAVVHEGSASGEPGAIVAVHRDAIDVAADPGVVRLTTVQLEGRPPVAVRAFLNGHPVAVGDRLEPLPQGA
jgi:methionyl-tRNA formyltransferase